MIKCFFTGSLFLSLISVLTISCSNEKPESKEAIRFETLLSKQRLQAADTIKYLLWNTMSCEGCRRSSVRLFQEIQNTQTGKVKFIVPPGFVSEIHEIKQGNVIVDTANAFDKFYLGIDNIGLITVYKGKVLRIRNYQPDEMNMLAKDLKDN